MDASRPGGGPGSDPGLFEIIHQLRAMRRLKPDPVPDELLWKVLEAGTKAPSGSNTQVWRFLVVRDDDGKRFLQERYERAWDLYLQAPRGDSPARPPSAGDQAARLRMVRSAGELAKRLHEVPVLLLVCMVPRSDLPPAPEGRPRSPAAVYASIFPAVQNVLLAARAVGLGAVLTTLHLVFEDEIKRRFGVPEEVETVALLPIGWPKGRFGPTRRRPVDEVTFWERWGARRTRG